MVSIAQIGRKLARKRAHKVIEASMLKTNRPKTGAELVQRLQQSGAIGAWASRDDIEDSSTYARQLREAAQNRERG